MMQDGGKHTDFVRRQGELWALHESTDQYRAWKCWLQLQIGVKYFGEWQTVTDEWPPMTQITADKFAQWLSDIRDEVDQEKGCKTIGKPVPRHPEPWDGYIPPAPAEKQERMVTPEFVRAFYKRNGLRILPEAAE